MNRTNLNLFVLFLFFGVYFGLDQLFFASVHSKMTSIFHNRTLGHISTYGLSLLPLLVGALLLRPKDQDSLISKFGLNGSLISGLAIGVLATLPMFIGYAFKFSLIKEPDFNSLMINTVSAGFFEELILGLIFLVLFTVIHAWVLYPLFWRRLSYLRYYIYIKVRIRWNWRSFSRQHF